MNIVVFTAVVFPTPGRVDSLRSAHLRPHSQAHYGLFDNASGGQISDFNIYATAGILWVLFVLACSIAAWLFHKGGKPKIVVAIVLILVAWAFALPPLAVFWE